MPAITRSADPTRAIRNPPTRTVFWAAFYELPIDDRERRPNALVDDSRPGRCHRASRWTSAAARAERRLVRRQGSAATVACRHLSASGRRPAADRGRPTGRGGRPAIDRCRGHLEHQLGTAGSTGELVGGHADRTSSDGPDGRPTRAAATAVAPRRSPAVDPARVLGTDRGASRPAPSPVDRSPTSRDVLAAARHSTAGEPDRPDRRESSVLAAGPHPTTPREPARRRDPQAAQADLPADVRAHGAAPWGSRSSRGPSYPGGEKGELGLLPAQHAYATAPSAGGRTRRRSRP